MRVSVTTRPSDKGEWRWGCGHSDSEKRWGGGTQPKKIVFGPKIKEGGLAPGLDPPLVKFNLSYLFPAFARPH